MKEIDLGQGLKAIVDDCDFVELSKHKWRAVKGKYTYYAVRTENGKLMLMHRQILGVSDRRTLVDHENGNGLLNTRDNLRKCTFQENNRNKRGYKNNNAKTKGVQQVGAKFSARITHNGKVFYLGLFANRDEAAAAYNKAAKELHGEFASLNRVA